MRILAIDWGQRRLGFAVSDETGVIALPVCSVTVKSEDHAIEETQRLLRETGAQKLILGLPLNMNGSKGPMAEIVEAFAGKLRQTVGLPVETWDERLSSRIAERALIEGDMSRRKRKKTRDKMAAQIILQGYLDSMDAAKDFQDEAHQP